MDNGSANTLEGTFALSRAIPIKFDKGGGIETLKAEKALQKAPYTEGIDSLNEAVSERYAVQESNLALCQLRWRSHSTLMWGDAG